LLSLLAADGWRVEGSGASSIMTGCGVALIAQDKAIEHRFVMCSVHVALQLPQNFYK
jgi:hypothetical protein